MNNLTDLLFFRSFVDVEPMNFNKQFDIKLASNIYMKLTDIIESINFVFSPVIMIAFAVSFGWFCLFVFIMILYLEMLWESYMLFAIANCLLNFYHFALIMAIIYACEATTCDGKLSLKLLFEIQNICEDLLMKKKVNLIPLSPINDDTISHFR